MANSNLSERQNSDSGSITYDGNRKTLSWTYVGAGDGMYSAFDPISATPTKGKWFTEAQNGFVLCSDNGIQNLDYCVGPWRGREIVGWSAPLKLDNFNCAKNDCRNVIFGAEYVYVFSGECLRISTPANDGCCLLSSVSTL